MDTIHTETNPENLILIPTLLEQQWAAGQLESLSANLHAKVHLCGLGLVQAGVNALRLVQTLQPKCVWLLGIAGTFENRLALAEAYEFTRIACYGIGVGNGTNYRSPADLGWSASLADDSANTIQCTNPSQDRLLISVAAASADSAEAELKLQKHPEAAAEDMESFAVAIACRAYGTPLRVIRGISNCVGDRDHRRWRSAEAMQAAVELASGLVKNAQSQP